VEGDDIYESFLVQLEWLKDAGFQEVDIFCKLIPLEYDRWEKNIKLTTNITCI
jgi:hypothetical protein